MSGRSWSCQHADLMQPRGLFLKAAVLALVLSAMPPSAVAQGDTLPQAMIEGNATDITSWTFAARVPVGGTITWRNQGSQGHTVTAVDKSFDSGIIAPGSAATIEFDSPGTFTYVCSVHPSMKGAVVVSDDPPSASPMAIVEGKASDVTSWGFAVSISVGQSVSWVNLGSQGHTATALDASFDTGLLPPGGSQSFEFDTPGIYPYLCTPHPWMKGNVSVS